VAPWELLYVLYCLLPDMEVAARQAAHDAWGAGAAQVVVATVAFGRSLMKYLMKGRESAYQRT
jgi:hypothetical protein